MDPNHLRSLLEHLHQEISANPPTDEHHRALLADLQRDIQRALTPPTVDEPSAPPAATTHGLRERVQEFMASYEGAHPQAVGALERVLVLLSNFGL